MSTSFQEAQSFSYLSAGSMNYIDDLYDQYLKDPMSVTEEWRAFFKKLPVVRPGVPEVSHRDIEAYFLDKAQNVTRSVGAGAASVKEYQVAQIINAYRSHGHLLAHIDPLNLKPIPHVAALDIGYYGFTLEDLSQAFPSSPYWGNACTLSETIQALQNTYCRSIGAEYMHISDVQQVNWFQEKLEVVRGNITFSKDKKMALLKGLIAADGLERYLGTKYAGQKRFSLEGGDAFIPMLREIIELGGAGIVEEIVIGMAHRGRLNVLINVLGKSPTELFKEFEGQAVYDGTGDVKYHMGFSTDIRTTGGRVVHATLAFNPSHLEIISPVVEGSVRARMQRLDDMDSKAKVLPIVVHGDAAFAGQGVVMETFSCSQTPGYTTGGTIHIVINNQVGFTTSKPCDARSTTYCTDIAKMIDAPILHVNGDDPEAVLFTTQLAFEYRMRFKRDIVIDLVCYRRHGHNEADEPAITQPAMYQKIKSMRPLREVYGAILEDQGVITNQELSAWNNQYRDQLDEGAFVVDRVLDKTSPAYLVDWSPYMNTAWNDTVDTSISLETLDRLSNIMQTRPQGFELHPVVAKLMAERQKMTEGALPMNWGYAETMAYASLLEKGYGVRLSGQDCGRGTFAHRHAVLHDLQTDETYVPLAHIPTKTYHSFAVIDSLLSEEAVLAFEYGYSASEPNTLVLWEAQFGDFANGAQVVIDQFISSGEQKWGRFSGLVMLLPHGYEGQGPEHSSARLERYMQLCAEHNIQVCVPTTPAQMFHLLRRQMLRPYRKPLIVMTPKSLLRHKLAVSSLRDLTEGAFQTVIPEQEDMKPSKVKRVVLCTGKVYYDIFEKRQALGIEEVAIVRIEQLYPFPEEAVLAALSPFKHVKEVVWCQEEPQNQGAWFASQHHMHACLSPSQQLRYVGRSFAAAPAVGSAIMHAKQQAELVLEALTVK
jgi:2-oxoglutarate dehydrogenase E1 component